MKRLSISNVHQREAAKLFFDFYSMSLLRFYAGKNSLNHACRIRRIEEAYEQVVEKFYSEVRRCLHYSVLREFRHFRYETYETESDSYKHKFPYGQLVRLSRKLSTQFDNGSLDKFLEGRGQLKEDYPLDQIVDGYFNHEWGVLLWW